MCRDLLGSLAAGRSTPWLKWAGLLLAVALAAKLSGCGQKGPLYMQPAPATAAAAASAPAR